MNELINLEKSSKLNIFVHRYSKDFFFKEVISNEDSKYM